MFWWVFLSDLCWNCESIQNYVEFLSHTLFRGIYGLFLPLRHFLQTIYLCFVLKLCCTPVQCIGAVQTLQVLETQGKGEKCSAVQFPFKPELKSLTLLCVQVSVVCLFSTYINSLLWYYSQVSSACCLN